MARRIAYIGEPVLTLDQVAYQCRLEPEDLQPELIEQIIIPGVTGQAESRSGAAIRMAEYEDEWPEHYGSGHALDQGQAKEIISISRIRSDGSEEALTVVHHLRVRQRESFLYFPEGRPPGDLLIRYRAGLDLEQYPAVRSWLLMHAATAFENRETLVIGTILAELPGSILDTLLGEITVPPRF
ncbi:hypothetical protein PS673_02922 [Pseudomonas fluorescens]|uniref:Uncharacterized protein n=1 Tax=Pseudomonas fluorescens TaxID=294 RepID=A0A5E6TK07_PSEFL|nr:hypothetical protein [Pseudomonas fluorescens]VVM93709.1 hypothetical protein PS673_02922 [Pseudomonas fluorescens]